MQVEALVARRMLHVYLAAAGHASGDAVAEVSAEHRIASHRIEDRPDGTHMLCSAVQLSARLAPLLSLVPRRLLAGEGLHKNMHRLRCGEDSFGGPIAEAPLAVEGRCSWMGIAPPP